MLLSHLRLAAGYEYSIRARPALLIQYYSPYDVRIFYSIIKIFEARTQ